MNVFDILTDMPAWVEALDSNLAQRLRGLSSDATSKMESMANGHFQGPALGLSNSMANAGFSDQEMLAVLTAGGAGSPHCNAEAINQVIAKSRDEIPRGSRGESKWPDEDQVAIGKLGVMTAVELAGRFPRGETGGIPIMKKLFPDDPLLCLAREAKEVFRTQKLSEWIAEKSGARFIVPSPMSARTGIMDNGKESGRCLANTGPRKYLITEFDTVGKDVQRAIICHLATIAPLVLVVDSGGKSLQAWWRCDDASEADLRRFMAYAVSLGADRATWTRCQLVRLPGGTRDNGKMQAVLVFRPTDAADDTWHLQKLEELVGIPPTGKRFRFTPLDKIELATESRDFVEGLLTDGGFSALYAPPGGGKSFLALDLAAAVASGRQWRDREVDGGAVVYFCLEGQQGFRQRIAALKQNGKLPPGAQFYLVESNLNLLDPADVPAFIKAARAQVENIRMIVIDTLAMAMPGGSENAPEDMGSAINGAKAMQSALGAHVMIVHHTGKDTRNGMRGHSSLHGAVDTALEISTSGDSRVVMVKKQKDFEAGVKLAFKLIPFPLGWNQRGKEITTCTVDHLSEGLISEVKKGPKQKFSNVEFLNLLPQPARKDWEDAAVAQLKTGKTTFRNRVKELTEGVDYEIDSKGVFERIVSEDDCF
jgi:hypothetical protein